MWSDVIRPGRLISALAICLLLIASLPVQGAEHSADAEFSRVSEDGYRYNISTSVWTTHFNPQPEHNNTQRFIGLERYGDNYVSAPLQARFNTLEQGQPLIGIAHFSNSYDQSTWYAYAGFNWPFWRQRGLQANVKVTAGFIHGYRNEFQYKIPFNSYGTSPAAIPSLTLRYRQLNSEIILFGISGMMLNVGYSF